jgi:hypothetical protein
MSIRDASLRYGTPGARMWGTQAVIAVGEAPTLQEEVGVVRSVDGEGRVVQKVMERETVDHCAHA